MSEVTTGVKKFWAFAKPVVIVVFAAIDFFASNQDVPKNIFIAIIILSIVLRGRSIGAGFLALWDLITKKKE